MFALLATVIRRTAPLAFLKGVTLPHSLPTLRSRSPCASWAPPLHWGLVRDHSPHRTTMTQTKRCPIFKFGSWWSLPQQKSLAENDANSSTPRSAYRKALPRFVAIFCCFLVEVVTTTRVRRRFEALWIGTGHFQKYRPACSLFRSNGGGSRISRPSASLPPLIPRVPNVLMDWAAEGRKSLLRRDLRRSIVSSMVLSPFRYHFAKRHNDGAGGDQFILLGIQAESPTRG